MEPETVTSAGSAISNKVDNTVSDLAEFAGSLWSTSQSVKSARERMRFEEKMSSTAHQREVIDLMKAGLNPILSAGGSGASQPQGANIQVENPLRGLAQRSLQQRIALDEARLRQREIWNKDKERKLIMQNTNLSSAQAAKVNAERELSEKELEMKDKEMQYMDSQINVNSAAAARQRIESIVQSYDIPGKANIARAQRSWLGKAAPYVQMFAPGLGQLMDAAIIWNILSPKRPTPSRPKTTEIHGRRGGETYTETRTQFED